MSTKKPFLFVTIVFLLLGVSGCGSPTTVRATLAPATALPTIMPETPVPVATSTTVPLPVAKPSDEPTRGINLSGITQLTHCHPQCLGPAWLPDGKQISYFSGETGKMQISNLQGESVQTLALPAGANSPVWSPDGKWLAFSTPGEGENNLTVMSADGTSQQLVLSGPAEIGGLTWSQDSQTLYCTLLAGDFSAKIVKIGRDGSDLEQIAALPGKVMGVVFSPAAQSVVYITLSGAGRPEALRLLKLGETRSKVLVERGVSSPAWSADGQRISFETDFPDSEIYVINLDGTGLTKVTEHLGFADKNAVWSPDGTCLAFSANSVTGAGQYAADDQVYLVCNW